MRAEGLVQIDANKKYKGMNASFAKGYTPSVKKDTMRLVIPFRTDAAVQGGPLLIGVSFEREENSPFYFKNYQKQVKPSANGVYLYKCKIRLRKDRINGQYPLHLSVLVKTAEGNMREEFTIYAEITDGREALPLGEETQGKMALLIRGRRIRLLPAKRKRSSGSPESFWEKMICRERSFWRAAAYFGH